MSKFPENLFTILQFGSGEDGCVYRGEKALDIFESDALNAYEKALDELDQDIQRLRFVGRCDYRAPYERDEWKDQSLTSTLEAVAENGIEIEVRRESSSMASQAAVPKVIYFGFAPSLASILTDTKFAEVLENNSYSLADENGEPIDYSQVSTGSVWVYDPATETGLAVIHDGLIETSLSSPGFESILRVMDDFVKKNDDRRLFLAPYEEGMTEVYHDSEEFNWMFDLESGQYLEPKSE